MHLIATYLLFFVDWAFSTSEKVPSPFLLISRYSRDELLFGLGSDDNGLLTVHYDFINGP